MKKITSLLIALLLVFSLAVPAFAASASIEYSGHKIFEFNPGSSYTDTDLFPNFKNVMPGDTLTQVIDIENTARCCDYIKVYIQAVLHDEEDNEISPNVLAELTADQRREAQSQLDYMHDFLSQLTLTVELEDGTIFHGKPNELDGLADGVYLGKLDRGDETSLTATLEVPITLDNAFANRIGEVDWKLYIEEFDYGSDNPKTGDHMQQYLLPAVLVMSVSAAALAILLIARRRKDKKK